LKKKIVDTNYLYITARIRSLERSLLSNARMERMLEARSDEDALKVLSECGYGEVTVTSAEELELILSETRDSMLSTLERIAPDRALIKVFRTKYDYHNLKALLKSEALSLDAQPLLIDSGRIQAKALFDMIRQDDLRNMPNAMRNAAVDARELLSRTGDPQLSDVLLDHACFKEMREMAKEAQSKFLIGYVKLFIDAANLRAIIRALRIGYATDFIRGILAAGGNINPTRLFSVIVSGSSLAEFYTGTLLEEAAATGTPAIQGDTPLTMFERLCDEALIKYMKASKLVAFGDQPLIGYIAAREAEFIAIRTIMSGRKAGVSRDVLRERLRDAYV